MKMILILTSLFVIPFLGYSNTYNTSRNIAFSILVSDGDPKKSNVDAGEATITRNCNKVSYQWTHIDRNGGKYDFGFTINFTRGWQKMQNIYKRYNHHHGNYQKFVNKDPYRKDLYFIARLLRKIARQNYLNEIDVALSFVQSFPYQEQMGTYQRYAIETLIDGRGDCSDTSVLFAGILKVWDYDCIFLKFPDHLAVGLWCTGDIYQSYYNHRRRKFYYCETTNTGWGIGEIPKDYEGKYATFEEVYY